MGGGGDRAACLHPCQHGWRNPGNLTSAISGLNRSRIKRLSADAYSPASPARLASTLAKLAARAVRQGLKDAARKLRLPSAKRACGDPSGGDGAAGPVDAVVELRCTTTTTTKTTTKTPKKGGARWLKQLFACCSAPAAVNF